MATRLLKWREPYIPQITMRGASTFKRSTSCSALAAGTEGAGPDGHTPASAPCIGSCPGSAIGSGPKGSEEGLGPRSRSGLDPGGPHSTSQSEGPGPQSTSGLDGPGLTGESCKIWLGPEVMNQVWHPSFYTFGMFFLASRCSKQNHIQHNLKTWLK